MTFACCAVVARPRRVCTFRSAMSVVTQAINAATDALATAVARTEARLPQPR
jgi:hypothetical protein